MAIDVAPGTLVEVKIARHPRRAAAAKTLERLFRKDPRNKKELARLKESRITRWERRGGRLWADRPAILHPFRIERGASCKIVATLPVLKDLASLGDVVEVKPTR